MRSFIASIYARHEGKILLVNHKLHGWVPVGGHLEPGERPVDAAVRELREEVGWQVLTHYEFGPEIHDSLAPMGMIGYSEHTAGPHSSSGVKGWHMNFSFLVSAKTSVIHPCDEFTEHGWFASLSDVPGDVTRNVRTLFSRALKQSQPL